MLLQLPMELIYLVAQELGPISKTPSNPLISDRAMLAPLSLVCHLLHEILRPILFEKITLTGSALYSVTNTKLISAKRAISQYPGLARQVRYV